MVLALYKRWPWMPTWEWVASASPENANIMKAWRVRLIKQGYKTVLIYIDARDAMLITLAEQIEKYVKLED